MKQVILAPRCYHKYLRNLYRKDDVFFNAKFLTIDDLLKCIYGSVDKEFVFKLFDDEKYSYKLSKNIISFLPYIVSSVSEKEKQLLALKEKAKELNFISKDEYIEQLLKREIHVYGYSKDDRLLIKIAKEFNISYSFKTIDEFFKEKPFYEFENLEEEIVFIFNKILTLYDQGISLNDIYIFGVNETNKDLLIKLASRYKVPLNNVPSSSMNKSVYFKTFIKRFMSNHDFNEALEYSKNAYSDNEQASNLFDYISSFYKEEYSYDKLLEVIKEEIKNYKIETIRYTNAVNVSSSIKLVDSKYVFVLDFNNDNYPKTFMDNDYLDDEIKSRNIIYTSLEKNINNKEEILTFLNSNNEITLCFAKKYMSTNFYPSYLLDEISVKKFKGTPFDYDYSSFTALMRLARLKDIEKKYQKRDASIDSLEKIFANIPYSSYDNAYKKFDAVSKDKKLTLSYSKLDIFNKCAFHYYLKYVLHLNNTGDTFNLDLGSLAHHILENGSGRDIDFDTLFSTSLKEFSFTKQQLFIVNNLKEYFKAALDVANAHYHNMNNPELRLENEYKYVLNKNTEIVGRIDKSIITEDKSVWLIDYKTSFNNFTFANAKNNDKLQLPVYALLFSSKESFKDYEIKGLYYYNLLPAKMYAPDNDINNLKYLKLQGVTVKDLDAIKNFDMSYESNERSNFINIPYVSSSFPTRGACFIEGNDVNEIKQIALDNFINMEEKIRDNDFLIKPKKEGLEGSCKYCEFNDICFHKQNNKEEGEDD